MSEAPRDTEDRNRAYWRANLMLMPGNHFDVDADPRAAGLAAGAAAEAGDSHWRVRLTYGRLGGAALLERWSDDLRRHGVKELV